jgi:hypothetical protein
MTVLVDTHSPLLGTSCARAHEHAPQAGLRSPKEATVADKAYVVVGRPVCRAECDGLERTPAVGWTAPPALRGPDAGLRFRWHECQRPAGENFHQKAAGQAALIGAIAIVPQEQMAFTARTHRRPRGSLRPHAHPLRKSLLPRVVLNPSIIFAR